MNDATRAFGETQPEGRPQAGRIHHPPTTIEMAKARVVYQMDFLDDNCRDGIDVGYAVQCLDEAIEDYFAIQLGS